MKAALAELVFVVGSNRAKTEFGAPARDSVSHANDPQTCSCTLIRSTMGMKIFMNWEDGQEDKVNHDEAMGLKAIFVRLTDRK